MNKPENMVMNKRAGTARLGKMLITIASLILCLGMGAPQAMAATTPGGNMTAYGTGAIGGIPAGGTNDVAFEITGPLYTSVSAAGAGGVNGTITSDNPFFGFPWTTQVWLYGTGTYTVYDGCASGDPGCGTGTALTFTVGAGEMGGHILFNWSGYTNLDLVTVWSPNTTYAAVNGAYEFFEGVDNTPPDGVANTAATTFSWVSIVSKGSVMGAEAGDMEGYGPNFNLQAPAATVACTVDADCNDNNPSSIDVCNASNVCEHSSAPTAPTLVSPENGQTGLASVVEFRWTKSIDADNDPITYTIYYCTTPGATNCAPVTVASRSSKGLFYAGGAGLLMIGMTFFGGMTGRKRTVLLLLLVLCVGGTFASCYNRTEDNNSPSTLPATQQSYSASGLTANTTYYWKVTASDGTNQSASGVSSFTTE